MPTRSALHKPCSKPAALIVRLAWMRPGMSHAIACPSDRANGAKSALAPLKPRDDNAVGAKRRSRTGSVSPATSRDLNICIPPSVAVDTAHVAS
jgi:hypothetical protein